MENKVDKREIIFSISQEICKTIEEINKQSEQRAGNGDLLYLMNIECLCGKLHGYLESLIIVDDSYKSFVTEYEKINSIQTDILKVADEIYRRLKEN